MITLLFIICHTPMSQTVIKTPPFGLARAHCGRSWGGVGRGRQVGRKARRISLLVQFAVASALLAACNTMSGVADLENAHEPDVLERIRSVDLLPRTPNQVQQTELSTGRRAK